MIAADWARCDIIDRDWSPPPRPPDCEFDYGQGISAAPGERAQFVCAGDTAFGPDAILPYGESISAAALRCESTEAGITCRDLGTPTASRFLASRISSSELLGNAAWPRVFRFVRLRLGGLSSSFATGDVSFVARGCSAVGSASPCQGEGRGFESRHPLEGASGINPRGGVAEW